MHAKALACSGARSSMPLPAQEALDVQGPYQNAKGWLHHSAWPPSAGSAPTENIYGLVDMIGREQNRVRVRVPAADGEYTVPVTAIFPANASTTADMSKMPNMSEATVLDNLIQRYMASEPYTFTGDILMSVNPYRILPRLYSAETLISYAGQHLGDRPPHLYAIAEQVGA